MYLEAHLVWWHSTSPPSWPTRTRNGWGAGERLAEIRRAGVTAAGQVATGVGQRLTGSSTKRAARDLGQRIGAAIAEGKSGDNAFVVRRR